MNGAGLKNLVIIGPVFGVGLLMDFFLFFFSESLSLVSLSELFAVVISVAAVVIVTSSSSSSDVESAQFLIFRALWVFGGGVRGVFGGGVRGLGARVSLFG